MCKINRKGIGKYQPSDRGKNSSDKLLPRSLFFGRDNGIKPYEGHEKDTERKERTQMDDIAGCGGEDRQVTKEQPFDILAEDQKHHGHNADQHKDQGINRT